MVATPTGGVGRRARQGTKQSKYGGTPGSSQRQVERPRESLEMMMECLEETRQRRSPMARSGHSTIDV